MVNVSKIAMDRGRAIENKKHFGLFTKSRTFIGWQANGKEDTFGWKWTFENFVISQGLN